MCISLLYKYQIKIAFFSFFSFFFFEKYNKEPENWPLRFKISKINFPVLCFISRKKTGMKGQHRTTVRKFLTNNWLLFYIKRKAAFGTNISEYIFLDFLSVTGRAHIWPYLRRVYFLKRYNTVIFLYFLAKNKAYLYKRHAWNTHDNVLFPSFNPVCIQRLCSVVTRLVQCYEVEITLQTSV